MLDFQSGIIGQRNLLGESGNFEGLFLSVVFQGFSVFDDIRGARKFFWMQSIAGLSAYV